MLEPAPGVHWVEAEMWFRRFRWESSKPLLSFHALLTRVVTSMADTISPSRHENSFLGGLALRFCACTKARPRKASTRNSFARHAWAEGAPAPAAE